MLEGKGKKAQQSISMTEREQNTECLLAYHSLTLTVSSMEQEATKSPQEWKEQPHVAPVWPSSVSTQRPSDRSQIRRLASPPVVPSFVPSGWKLTPESQSVCPSPVAISSPSGRPHSLHRLSSLADANTSLLGCRARQLIGRLWALGGLLMMATEQHHKPISKIL